MDSGEYGYWLPAENRRRPASSIVAELRRIRTLLEADPGRVGIGGASLDLILDNWPVPGVRRHILSDRRQLGNDNLVIPAQTSPATFVCGPTPGRLAGSIVNIGPNACFIYAADPGRVVYQAGGVLCGYLTANGSWDFLWSNTVWEGYVSAISPSGTTLVWGQT